MTTAFLCAACGTQFAESSSPPDRCPLCEDSRAFGSPRGARQRWISLAELRSTHRNRLDELEDGVVSIRTEPWFGVGQHCLLVRGASGNVLWDCIALIDDATISAVRAFGGIARIAISHPHFYAAMIEWSRAFGDVPIHLHVADREWVMRSDPAVVAWEGARLQLDEDLTLVHCAGHFPGSAVLHAARRGDRPACLFSGDTINVLEDRRHLSFMHNYPKQIPLPAPAVRRIARAVEPLAFDRVYGCWPQNRILAGGKRAVRRSAERHIRQFAA
ncbi:MAG TPA: MBL fold metallo-hydrolase [Myxococcota bacterium]|nr:MBL fold metallo-hydrolase [Myxococcota bacterium]